MTGFEAQRTPFYTELLHFMEAYHLLSEQAQCALEREEVELLDRLLELRMETIRRIEAFRAERPDLMKLPFLPLEEETDPSLGSIRRRLSEIVADCQRIDRELDSGMRPLKDRLAEQARALAKDQKSLKGYVPLQDKRGRYVREKK